MPGEVWLLAQCKNFILKVSILKQKKKKITIKIYITQSIKNKSNYYILYTCICFWITAATQFISDSRRNIPPLLIWT